MNSRIALATLTTVGLCLGGVATAQVANSEPTTPAAPTSETATETPTPETPAAETPTGETPTSGVTTTRTTTTTVTETPVTVTETTTPAPPTDLSSRIVAASTLSERGQLVFAIISAVLAAVGGLVQVATILVAANPELGTQAAMQLAAFLDQMGVQL